MEDHRLYHTSRGLLEVSNNAAECQFQCMSMAARRDPAVQIVAEKRSLNGQEAQVEDLSSVLLD